LIAVLFCGIMKQKEERLVYMLFGKSKKYDNKRLMLLQDFFIKNADKTHAVSMEDIRRYYLDNGIEDENMKVLRLTS